MALLNKQSVSRLVRKIGNEANDIINRSLDKHVSLAVTGLSQSGKTAFITSLVNQLINEGHGQPLTFFDTSHQGRFIGAKRIAQKNLHIPRFDYDGGMQRLTAHPPTWPEPTSNISELRLAIRYYANDSLLNFGRDMRTLYLDITDYPGEWLLDLPMLEQSYQQWSEHITELLQSEPRKSLSEAFLQRVAELDPFAPVDENLLADLAEQYTELLHQFRYQQGLSVIQPGRFILPGEHKGAPVLQFIPFPFFATLDLSKYKNADEHTMIGMLHARYRRYRDDIVGDFYKNHFARFDRQIILADCLTPLNNGHHAFTDLQYALSLIMDSFRYGNANILARLFSPKIDRLLFAANKADHVTSDQHQQLVELLERLVVKAKKQLTYDAIKMKSLAIASIKATEQGKTEYQGKQLQVVKGQRLDNGEKITLFPGSVPERPPNKQLWPEQGFNFVSFAPPNDLHEDISLPHIRLDHVLQFLLGDKLR